MEDVTLERCVELDSRYVMHTYKRLPVAFVRGKGTRLWDSAGREYLDLLGGLGVVVLGHGHPAVTTAIEQQAASLLHTTNLYYVEPQALLARTLVEGVFPGSKCFFCNSGAEANEGALKLARKYHFLCGDPRSKVVCLLKSFHGRTLMTLSATGQPAKWEPFGPVVDGFVHVAMDDIAALEEAVDGSTAAVLIEPVIGEGGVYPLEDEFLATARRLCNQTGAVLIFDEVQSGMGRTGTFLASSASGIKPDVLTLAKGLANGIPVGVFMGMGEFGDVLEPGDHGTTFGGGFLACAAGLACVSTILDERLAQNAAEVGARLKGALEEMVGTVPLVTGVRGRGLMLATQLSESVAREVVMECLARGVVVNDVAPDAVRVLPPLTLTEEEALEGARLLADAVTAVGERGGAR
ncbi:MAG: acetylornithine/succinylornithine family transaminase [Actinomycetota bacterium]